MRVNAESGPHLNMFECDVPGAASACEGPSLSKTLQFESSVEIVPFRRPCAVGFKNTRLVETIHRVLRYLLHLREFLLLRRRELSNAIRGSSGIPDTFDSMPLEGLYR